jgi:hypothetical protein
LVEAKLARNSKFWHGLEQQLPKYLEGEDVSQGVFTVCVHRDAEIARIQDINARVAALNDRLPYQIRVVIVDARANPPSASHLPTDP